MVMFTNYLAQNGARSKKTVLIIEDHPLFGDMLVQAIISVPHYQVIYTVVTDSLQVLEIASTCTFHVLIIDEHLLFKKGMSLDEVAALGQSFKGIPLIILGTEMLPTYWLDNPQVMRLSNPFSVQELLHALQNFLQ
jgi:DNA-binding response OmpR family regulator